MLDKLLPASLKARERLRTALLLVGAAGAGYLLTCVAYPAPLMTRDHAVERVLGLPLATAEQELTAAGLKPKVLAAEPDPVIPAGHISWQDPPPGTLLPSGALVQLTPSSGPPPVSVPDVAGFEVDQARQVLEAAGLRIGERDTVPSAMEAGVIVATRPSSGTTRPPGARIGLVLSKGPADIRVPDLSGLEQEEARRRLEAVGLKLGKISHKGGRPSGVVLEQRPAPGIMSPRESRVDLVISN